MENKKNTDNENPTKDILYIKNNIIFLTRNLIRHINYLHEKKIDPQTILDQMLYVVLIEKYKKNPNLDELLREVYCLIFRDLKERRKV